MTSLARNAICLSGIGSLAYGLWLAWPPLAFVVGGGAVLFLVVWIQRSEKDKPQ